MRWMKHLSAPIYVVGGVLIFLPVLDLALSIAPIRLSDPAWRFGAEGLLSRALLTPVLGLLIWLVVSAVLENRRILRLISGACALLALSMIAVAVMFVLDALQVRPRISAEAKVAFEFTAVTALLKHAVYTVVALVMARSGWKAARRSGGSREATARTPVVGQDDGARTAASSSAGVGAGTP
jgi:hypothetical protein